MQQSATSTHVGGGDCVRYVHRVTKVARSECVPQAGCEPPVPGWKGAEWAQGFLPAGDPAT